MTALSPKLHLDVYDYYTQSDERSKYNVERIPAIVMGDDSSARLKFYGIPMGHEFATIVEDVKTLSRGVSPLAMDSRKKATQSKPARAHTRVCHTLLRVLPECGQVGPRNGD